MPFLCEGAKATFIRLAQVTARILLVASETNETLIDVNDADDGFAALLEASCSVTELLAPELEQCPQNCGQCRDDRRAVQVWRRRPCAGTARAEHEEALNHVPVVREVVGRSNRR